MRQTLTAMAKSVRVSQKEALSPQSWELIFVLDLTDYQEFVSMM